MLQKPAQETTSTTWNWMNVCYSLRTVCWPCSKKGNAIAPRGFDTQILTSSVFTGKQKRKCCSVSVLMCTRRQGKNGLFKNLCLCFLLQWVKFTKVMRSSWTLLFNDDIRIQLFKLHWPLTWRWPWIWSLLAAWIMLGSESILRYVK